MSVSPLSARRRALISVSDKTGLADFAAGLHQLGFEIISTGGTATFLRDAGLPIVSVSDITQFPEIMDGRVKTLHPAIHGGILADLNEPSHRDALQSHGIAPIELVAINLYPFEKTAADKTASRQTIIKNIDVGGPAMIRAAAKNHVHVAVVTDAGDYAEVLEELKKAAPASPSLALKEKLAAKAFARTGAYDAAIAAWFAQSNEEAPSYFALSGNLVQTLRYGENPHQSAALYCRNQQIGPSLVAAELVQGKELSYNNITDADAAFELISEFAGNAPAAVAIIKHANPCGAATGATILEAYQKALACDPTSAFGGIVALNRPLDEELAKTILKVFTEVVIAPSASPEARAAFAAKPNVRLLVTGGLLDPEIRPLTFRSVSGGILVQQADLTPHEAGELKVVTERAPSETEIKDMLFAMRIAKHVRSNAVVFAKDSATLGVGAGQMSRIDSARIGIWKAREIASAHSGDKHHVLKGAVVASDAFLPFPDTLEAAAEAGVSAMIQPGGSMRDQSVIDAANKAGMAMVFTGLRHFRH